MQTLINIVKVVDTAFKMYNQNTQDKQQKYFDKRLCGARVITENAYEMLKGRWCFLYKKNRMPTFQLMYVVMACIALQNICIDRYDPCQPRSRLDLEQLELMEKLLSCAVDKEESNLIRLKINKSLWMDHSMDIVRVG